VSCTHTHIHSTTLTSPPLLPHPTLEPIPLRSSSYQPTLHHRATGHTQHTWRRMNAGWNFRIVCWETDRNVRLSVANTTVCVCVCVCVRTVPKAGMHEHGQKGLTPAQSVWPLSGGSDRQACTAPPWPRLLPDGDSGRRTAGPLGPPVETTGSRRGQGREAIWCGVHLRYVQNSNRQGGRSRNRP